MSHRFLCVVAIAVAGLAAGCDDDDDDDASATNSTGSGGSSSDGGGGSASSANGGNGGAGASGGSGGAGASGGGGTGGASGDWEAFCDAREALCSGGGADKCKMQEACAKDLLKDEIEEALFECLATNCREDGCLAATEDTPLTATGESFLEDCLAHLDTCPDASDDVCAAAYFVDDAPLAELGACFTAGSCAEIETCRDAWGTTHVESCEDWL